MESRDPPPLQPREALSTVGSTCFVPAKHTGLVSLIIQFVILLVSVLVVLFFFYHVGGYEYMGWNENSTILEPVYNHGKHAIATLTTELPNTTTEEEIAEDFDSASQLLRMERDLGDVFDDGVEKVRNILNDTLESVGNFTTAINGEHGIFTSDNDTEEIHIPDTIIHIMDAELDMLEMIRISTLAYIVLAILWFISLALLLFSIKFEIIDMVVINAICMTAAIMYLFIHAIFIAVLLYYQRELSLRTMCIVIGSSVVLFISVLLGAFCLFLVVSWYKYIMYMNDGEKCYCVALCVGLIKGESRQPPSRAQEYAMREAGRNPNEITYTEPPIQNFSSF